MSHCRIIALLFSILLVGTSASYAQEKGSAAFLKSLVIPGWGQYEHGRKNHALAFLSADLLLIGAALSLDHHGRQLQRDYKTFASSHAGVTGSHSKEFYIDVANWISVFDYNDQRMADRNFSAIYNTETEYWQWDSEANRARMDEMRVTSDRSLNRVIYAVALVGVNHLVSAFHAARLQTQASGKVSDRVGWKVSPERVSGGGKVNFSMWW